MTAPEPAAHDAEPDYRFSLANERTVLAWFRTALALLAASIGVAQLLPELAVDGARTAVSAALGALSVLASAGGVLRWRRVQAAMRRAEPLPPAPFVVVQAIGLMLVTVAVVVLASW